MDAPNEPSNSEGDSSFSNDIHRTKKYPNMEKGKLIIFSAPSGSGKSTLINYLLTQDLHLAFSISATSRPPRGTEQNGVEYFFLSPEEFKQRIANDEFLEYEEVYENRFYGTLKAQVEKQLEAGQNVVFDVDVVGGCNIKKYYGERALSVFIQPPSVEELRKRLTGRATDAPEVIESRIAKAEYELGFADKFDTVIINDDLEKAKADVLRVIRAFVEQ
ncbi:guanylate kinase [gut metagenome]|uniref:Guanylate kinase n=1 Tax=gut metagenome TaxID=749906 RepID=J9GT66_9ZZZZ